MVTSKYCKFACEIPSEFISYYNKQLHISNDKE